MPLIGINVLLFDLEIGGNKTLIFGIKDAKLFSLEK